MQSIDNVLKLRKGLKPDDPNPDIFDILWAKKLSNVAKDYTVTGNPLSFLVKKAQTAKSTKISMSPIQDLHGYDNPWPAGGGVNLLSTNDYNVTEVQEFEIEPIQSGTYSFSAVVTSTDTDKTQCAVIFLDENDTALSSKSMNRNTRNYQTFTVSDTITKIRLLSSTGTSLSVGDSSVWKDCMISSGSTQVAYAPYSNICPISGRTGVEIKGWGKNLADFPTATQLPMSSAYVDVVDFGQDVTFDSITLTFFADGAVCGKSSGALLCNFRKNDGTQDFRTPLSYDFVANAENNGAFSRTENNITFRILRIYLSSGYAQWSSGKMSVQLELGSTATTYEPYAESNDVTITFPALGKNKFNIENIPASGAVKNNGDGSLEITTGSGSSGVPVTGQKKLSEVVPDLVVGKTYYINATSTGSHKYVYCGSRWDFGSTKTITQTELDSTLYFYASGVNTVATISDFIICESTESDKSYEPYTNTVYGGTLDVETGELVVDKGYVDLGTLDWIKESAPYKAFRVQFNDAKFIGELICSEYKGVKTGSISYLQNGDISATNAQVLVLLRIRDDAKYDAMDSTEFKTAMSGVQLVYELATPRTIQLTPEQIQILKGQNNIWIEDEGATIALTYKN